MIRVDDSIALVPFLRDMQRLGYQVTNDGHGDVVIRCRHLDVAWVDNAFRCQRCGQIVHHGLPDTVRELREVLS